MPCLGSWGCWDSTSHSQRLMEVDIPFLDVRPLSAFLLFQPLFQSHDKHFIFLIQENDVCPCRAVVTVKAGQPSATLTELVLWRLLPGFIWFSILHLPPPHPHSCFYSDPIITGTPAYRIRSHTTTSLNSVTFIKTLFPSEVSSLDAMIGCCHLQSSQSRAA